ncbi:aromatic/alkene monooxygenase hydroxylase subunit beta [Marinobacterium sediminicola]|uniref:Phenol hydroxylase P1 protein n=1 Tax=Marinobacterium sediminicola TaxID=518898 RepID=A0ABY1S0N9_9GAMM|nr:aromatic/alkene monooxygenase hydroxylase subunit beta [Marinobacterium sediminicola]ULG68349.1 aromatic/alkene monooxygenase hydroxylase subunit beta [Marinobacterium sediminicola]SMR74772.1 Phenol hydroxylase P1 protein [Marinobacterium sediminicola]
MTIEIKTATLEPVRNTYANVERRFGDKPATRYQEATYDLQSETNFHYRPLWQPDLELNDPRRTAIVMSDWYAFKDPRQFYYGAYVQQRAKMQEVAESNYSFFENRDLARFLSDDARAEVIRYLVPLRHVEHTANLNNMYGTAYGYGTAITQAQLFNAMDRLGMAQYLSRIGLILDGNSGDALVEAKQQWLEADIWQGLRALCEETLVTEDWFEVMLAQNLVLDALITDLVYRQFDQKLSDQGAQDIGMLTEFMQLWNKDATRWMDAVLKTAVAESNENKELLQQWIEKWRGKAAEALSPLAEAMLGESALAEALEQLDKRVAKAGIK